MPKDTPSRLAGLYSDAMGDSGTWSGTYLGMIDHNVTTIVRALGGEAPKVGGVPPRTLHRLSHPHDPDPAAGAFHQQPALDSCHDRGMTESQCFGMLTTTARKTRS